MADVYEMSHGDKEATRPQAWLAVRGLNTDAQGLVLDRLRKGLDGSLPGKVHPIFT